MSSPFPLKRPVEPRADRGAAVLELDDEAADEAFEVLAARTTRRILLSLYDEPRVASDLAAAHDTTLQNVRYHLQKLLDADLIEVCGTWYSEQGTEMKVYAPTNESIVFVAGDDGATPTLVGALRRLFGAVALVGVASLLVQGASDWLARGRGGAAGGTELTTDASYARTATASQPFDPVAFLAHLVAEPGVQAFLLGTGVLLVAFLLWYRLRYRSRGRVSVG